MWQHLHGVAAAAVAQAAVEHEFWKEEVKRVRKLSPSQQHLQVEIEVEYDDRIDEGFLRACGVSQTLLTGP